MTTFHVGNPRAFPGIRVADAMPPVARRPWPLEPFVAKSLGLALIMGLLTTISHDVLAADAIPAFPGAEGFGAMTQGGRGGRIIKVTNLNASGPGSLNAACAERGPRIVVFDVAGVIHGDVAIRHSNITIAGQSAPEPGITLVGRLLSRPAGEARLKDVIVRFLRVRPLPSPGHTGDSVQMPHSERVILDHLSLSWANDEEIDIIHSSEVTVQWSTIEESDPEGHDKNVAHNFALLSAYPGSGNISIHHNLFAHHSRRAPGLSPGEPGKPGDFRNNVVYNFRDGLVHEGHRPYSAINMIGNYYKRGPNSDVLYPFKFVPEGRYFVSENYFHGYGSLSIRPREDLALPNWIRIVPKGEMLERPAPVAKITTHEAVHAYQLVLDRAGTWPRDRTTLRTIQEVRDGTGSWARHAPANPDDAWYMEGMRTGKVATDTDHDGMPDHWERQHGLDPKNPKDHSRILKSGYTAIETYLNERAAQRIAPTRNE